jgi:four helix bundle protein
MKSYKDLKAWQEAMSLATATYQLTANFPKSELYGLTQQMRKAAVSVPSNIGEGYGRRSAKQRYFFLEISLGSVFELETQIELCHRLAYIDDAQFEEMNERTRVTGRTLQGLLTFVAKEAEAEPKRHLPSRNPRNPPEEPEEPRNPRN